jgi:hypothetical protein
MAVSDCETQNFSRCNPRLAPGPQQTGIRQVTQAACRGISTVFRKNSHF